MILIIFHLTTSLFLKKRLNNHLNYFFWGPRGILARTSRSWGVIKSIPLGIGERNKLREQGMGNFSLDTGHFWLCGGAQGLKYDHLPDKEFEPTNECFNAVYQILNQIFKWCLWLKFVFFIQSVWKTKKNPEFFLQICGSVWSLQFLFT